MNICKYALFLLLIISNLCISVHAMQWSQQAKNVSGIDNNAIDQLYFHNTHFIWLDNEKLTNQAYDAMDFIAASSQQGLPANKYHFSQLKKLAPILDNQSATQFELLLSDGLLKLIHDIRVGQFNAHRADPDWFIPQKQFNAVEFLQHALVSKYLKTQLNTLMPNTAEYHTLIHALARYQSYVDRGGWPKIPSLPLLHPGDSNKNIPLIRTRLAFEETEQVLANDNNSTLYDPLLEKAVRHFQKKYSLKTDGIIGAETRLAMNISAQQRVQQIKVSLERHRWMPTNLGQRYLIINLANYNLTAINDGKKVLSMRVIVGRKSRQTPSFAATIKNLVFNPYWTVPRKLAKLDLLPKQQADPNYFYRHDIHVFTYENSQRIEQDPYSIDWESVTRSNFPYTFRQDPGEHNALGQIKFMFANPWGIYLHDTSHRNLFSQTTRSFSSGCIRVEHPIDLANFSLINPSPHKVLDLIEAKENRGLILAKSLPIYAVYFTAWRDKDGVRFSPDVYQRDKRMEKLL